MDIGNAGSVADLAHPNNGFNPFEILYATGVGGLVTF